MTDDVDWADEAEQAEEPDGDEEAIPVCPNCLAPFDPMQHYCSDCHEAVGQYTPYIPFVNIRFETWLARELWRRMISDSFPFLKRLLYLLILFAVQPQILIGTPFTLWERIRRKPPQGDA